VAGGVGGVLGGLVMTVWGGPRRLRMRGVLLGSLALAGACAVTGLRPTLWLVALGAGGMSVALTIVNGVYTTIVQVKVPQRFHGRVFALNTLIAWSTLPIGWALVGPSAVRLFDPLMAANGPLAGSVGRLIGTGPGRGTALMYLVFAFAMAGYVLLSLRVPTLARFDAEVPDAAPDDLVGLETRQRRLAGAPAGRTAGPEGGAPTLPARPATLPRPAPAPPTPTRSAHPAPHAGAASTVDRSAVTQTVPLQARDTG
jgi:hypothetical protein